MTEPRKIVTKYDSAMPVFSDAQWEATFDDYSPGDCIGFGATEQDAIDDLKLEAGWDE